MKVLAENKKAYYTYQILETFVAGISLIGQEVKSIKAGRINLAGSYVFLKDGEFFLQGSHVPPYQPKNAPADYDPERSRRLLLKKEETDYLAGKNKEKGLTLVPLKVYTNKDKGTSGWIKVEIGLARGKKVIDKREVIQKREVDREIKREIKSWGRSL